MSKAVKSIFPPLSPRGDNKFSLNGKVGSNKGCAPRYRTPDAMRRAVEIYFEDCEANEDPPTIPGLTLALGFSNRQMLNTYAKRDDGFAEIINEAKTRIEAYLNKGILKGELPHQGSIFLLKNHHEYADKAEVTNTNVVEVGDTLAEFMRSLQGTAMKPPAIDIDEYEVLEAAINPINFIGKEEAGMQVSQFKDIREYDAYEFELKHGYKREIPAPKDPNSPYNKIPDDDLDELIAFRDKSINRKKRLEEEKNAKRLRNGQPTLEGGVEPSGLGGDGGVGGSTVAAGGAHSTGGAGGSGSVDGGGSGVGGGGQAAQDYETLEYMEL